MKNRSSFAVRLAGASGLALLLSTSVFGVPQVYRRDARATEYRTDRISTHGRVSLAERQGNRYRVRLDHSDYDYFVPVETVGERNLNVGIDVRLGGIVAGDLVNVDMVALPGEAYYINDPNYVAVPFPSNGGWMSGVVQNVNRHLGYLTIMEDSSGRIVKIDVRHMDVRRPVNLWDVKGGDRISINGTWEARGNFDARRIAF